MGDRITKRQKGRQKKIRNNLELYPPLDRLYFVQRSTFLSLISRTEIEVESITNQWEKEEEKKIHEHERDKSLWKFVLRKFVLIVD